MKNKNMIQNTYAKLKTLTNARIGLNHSGISITTNHLLDFQLAHAMAQDAVYLELDTSTLDSLNMPTLLLHSQASNREVYLQRPDLGRRLDNESIQTIKNIKKDVSYDLAIVVADGLSSLAVHENACKFIQHLQKELADVSLATLCLVEQGRVAIGDEIGELLHAKAVIVLIGERPGLSSPDSLGLYFTWNPSVGLTDESRNCISNIRSQGLSYNEAVKKTMYLLKEAKSIGVSGVNLKDRTDTHQNQIKDQFLSL